jgi:hypothetical protein
MNFSQLRLRQNNRNLHQPWALTLRLSILGFDASTAEKLGNNHVAGRSTLSDPAS